MNLKLASIAALAVLGLSACANTVPTSTQSTGVSSAPTTGATSAAAPSTMPATTTAEETESGGEEVSNANFSLTVPAGWSQVTAGGLADNKDAIALKKDTNNGSNVVLYSISAPRGTAKAVIDQLKKQMDSRGTVRDADPITLDGTQAKGYAVSMKQSGVSVTQTQYFAEHGDKVTLVSFTAADDADMSALDDIVSSFAWK